MVDRQGKIGSLSTSSMANGNPSSPKEEQYCPALNRSKDKNCENISLKKERGLVICGSKEKPHEIMEIEVFMPIVDVENNTIVYPNSIKPIIRRYNANEKSAPRPKGNLSKNSNSTKINYQHSKKSYLLWNIKKDYSNKNISKPTRKSEEENTVKNSFIKRKSPAKDLELGNVRDLKAGKSSVEFQVIKSESGNLPLAYLGTSECPKKVDNNISLSGASERSECKEVKCVNSFPPSSLGYIKSDFEIKPADNLPLSYANESSMSAEVKSVNSVPVPSLRDSEVKPSCNLPLPCAKSQCKVETASSLPLPSFRGTESECEVKPGDNLPYASERSESAEVRTANSFPVSSLGDIKLECEVKTSGNLPLSCASARSQRKVKTVNNPPLSSSRGTKSECQVKSASNLPLSSANARSECKVKTVKNLSQSTLTKLECKMKPAGNLPVPFADTKPECAKVSRVETDTFCKSTCKNMPNGKKGKTCKNPVENYRNIHDLVYYPVNKMSIELTCHSREKDKRVSPVKRKANASAQGRDKGKSKAVKEINFSFKDEKSPKEFSQQNRIPCQKESESAVRRTLNTIKSNQNGWRKIIPMDCAPKKSDIDRWRRKTDDGLSMQCWIERCQHLLNREQQLQKTYCVNPWRSS